MMHTRRGVRWVALFATGLTLAAAGPTSTDTLFAALANAPNERVASELETRLQEVWHDQATPAVQMLIDHAVLAAAHDKQKEALADSDAAITLQPELADLWRRRAEARFGAGDDAGAVADLAQALSREPRLIPALADLSRYAELRHNDKRALEAWRKVLELDPKTEGGQKRLDRLQKKVNGEPI
jgi:tetratricopeptide (TPR) repeat protein